MNFKAKIYINKKYSQYILWVLFIYCQLMAPYSRGGQESFYGEWREVFGGVVKCISNLMSIDFLFKFTRSLCLYFFISNSTIFSVVSFYFHRANMWGLGILSVGQDPIKFSLPFKKLFLFHLQLQKIYLDLQ